MDLKLKVLEMVKDGKSVNYICENIVDSEIVMTRTKVADILMEYIKNTSFSNSEHVHNHDGCCSSDMSHCSIYSGSACLDDGVDVVETSEHDKNTKDFTVKYTGEKKTLDELISELDIDVSNWEVYSVTYNEWDAILPDNSCTTKLHQTKLYLRRIKSHVQYEALSVVNINILQDKEYVSSSKVDSDIKVAVILPDMHVGFRRNMLTGELVSIHDRRAIDVALQIVNYIKPDRIILLGDNLDLPQESKYPTGPEFYFTTQTSAIELAWWLAQFRKVDSEMRIDYIAGNHDCFSEDTEILTEYGWMKYYEVKDDTEIATFNKDSKNIEFQNFVDRQVYTHSGLMYAIENETVDLLVTQKHRMYLSSVDSPNDFAIETVGDFYASSVDKVQYCSGVNNRLDCALSDNEILIVSILFVYRDVTTVIDCSVHINVDNDDFELMGMLDSAGVEYTVVENHNEVLCKDNTICNRGYRVSVKIDKSFFDGLLQLLQDEKVMIDMILSLSKRQSDILLDSVFSGKSSRTCTRALLDKLQIISAVNGYSLNIIHRECGTYLVMLVENSKSEIKTTDMRIEKYVGVVWDFTVPNDTLVVRRNNKVSITGNCRVEKHIMQNSIAAYGLKGADDVGGYPLLSIPKLLGLGSLGVTYHSDYPSGKVIINDNLICIHGEVARSESGATVSAVVKNTRVSVIQGHIHRYEVATKTLWGANNTPYMYTSASFGCLCKIDPGVVPGNKVYQNWQQGIGVVYYEECGEQQFRQEFIPIINNRAILRTEVFNARHEKDIKHSIKSTITSVDGTSPLPAGWCMIDNKTRG